VEEPYKHEWSKKLGEYQRKEIEEFKRSYTNERVRRPRDSTRPNSVPSTYDVSDYLDTTLSGPVEACGEYDDEYDYASLKEEDGPGALSQVDLTQEQRTELIGDLGTIPAEGGGVNTELPDVGMDSDLVGKVGYYRYGDGDRHVFGTARTVWRLRAAGKLLADKGIVMGVGEMSKRGGPTPGHAEHQTGRDVDLRLVGKDGFSSICTVHRSDCYDREKTFEMIKTLIDVDPERFQKVLINDTTLQRQVNNYAREKYGITERVAMSCAGHDNHIHFSWKEGA
jgi:hypothetical protein